MWSKARSHRIACSVKRPQLAWLGACMALTFAAGAPGDDVGQGRDLFTREWLPGDPGRQTGDGLGPMYNDTSCVACHNQGGVGGAGSASKNVDLLTAVMTPVEGEPGHKDNPTSARLRELSKRLNRQGAEPTKPRAKGEAPDRRPLVTLHGGFRDESSLVLHRFGPDPNYEARRIEIINPILGAVSPRGSSIFRDFDAAFGTKQGVKRDSHPFPVEHGHFTVIHSQRNPAPLFGVGLIDAIPDAVLEVAARWKDSRFLEINGRLCRLTDGRIGRFGWKGDHASLQDFVLTACAVELGLEVPGHHQGVKPEDPDYRSPGLDLTKFECDALVAFVRKLPAPGENQPATEREALAIRFGAAIFDRIGCAACHRPELGRIAGIYSDLLLHDMGDQLSGAGSYGPHLPDPADQRESVADARFPSGPDAFIGGPPSPAPASRREWRTPPLWGIRDSGPYLHDGGAETLEQAIAFHGGEAAKTQNRYFHLKPDERICLQTFLKSLVAPEPGNARRAPRPNGPILTSTISQ